jgi:CheY-like chemotaxis protein
MPQPKILIVDDDAISRIVLRSLLNREPYTLLEASNGEQALRLADSESPDLILLDILMPGMQGDVVLHKLKAAEKTHSIPVIVVTALHSDDEIAACLDDGAVDYISKPYSATVMRSRLRAALRTHALHAQGG